MKLPKLVKNKKVMMIAGVLILAALFTTRIGFIAVENLSGPVITGTINVTAFEVGLDRDETWIWNIGESVPASFDSATIKGTVEFKVIMTGDPIDSMKLVVVGTSSGASPGGTSYFTPVTNSGEWLLYYDTTVLKNGQYTFTLSYTIDEMSSDGDVAFSSFAFLADDGDLLIDIPDTTMALIVLSVAGVLLGVFIVRKFKRT